MPELPEVETTCRGLQKHMAGTVIQQVLLSRSDLRKPVPDNLGSILSGKKVDQVKRRSKYILIFLEEQYVLLIHLGMSGRIIHAPRAIQRDRHDHLCWQINNGGWFHFRDPRRFGLIDLLKKTDIKNYPLFQNLGPEPLDDTFTNKFLGQILQKRDTPIKTLLLNQQIIAGIGNIYACESLFYAGISPWRPAKSLGKNEVNILRDMIRQTLNKAIAAGGSSARDYIQPSGEMGLFQHQWVVYDQEGKACQRPSCSGTIKRSVQAGRSTFYCPCCQQ